MFVLVSVDNLCCVTNIPKATWLTVQVYVSLLLHEFWGVTVSLLLSSDNSEFSTFVLQFYRLGWRDSSNVEHDFSCTRGEKQEKPSQSMLLFLAPAQLWNIANLLTQCWQKLVTWPMGWKLKSFIRRIAVKEKRRINICKQ